jgi:hypothetical protein
MTKRKIKIFDDYSAERWMKMLTVFSHYTVAGAQRHRQRAPSPRLRLGYRR